MADFGSDNIRQGATLIVAASDSLHSERADYICDGVNDGVEIQAAIDRCPATGGTVELMEGSYTVRSVTIDKALELICSSRATITPTSTYDTITVTSTDVTLRGCNILGGGDGYRIKVYKGAGAENRIQRLTLEDIFINGQDVATGFGLYINNINNVIGRKVSAVGCGDGCVHVIDAADVDFYSLFAITAGAEYAARFAGCANVNLFAPLFDSSPIGARLYANTGLNIFGGITIANTGIGIMVEDNNYGIYISGHEIKDNGGDGIKISNPNGDRVFLEFVNSHNNGGYGFDFISCPNLRYLQCYGWANTSGNINDTAGPKTLNHASGSDTGTGSQQTIAHGLGATPSMVIVVPTSTGADAYESAGADGTNIYVTAASGKTYSWYAII